MHNQMVSSLTENTKPGKPGQSPMQMHMAEQGDLQDRLEGRIDRLCGAIDAILTPPGPPAPVAAPFDGPDLSPLANTVRRRNERMQHLINRLDEVLDRVEL